MASGDRVLPGRDATWVAEYATATQVMFTFFEWRHKMLVRYAVVVTALAVCRPPRLVKMTASPWLTMVCGRK